MPYRLLGVKGPLAGRTFVVVKTEMRIGREPGNDLVIPDDYVSQLHATIIVRGDQHILVNASPNGTLVNGKKVDRTALKVGDELALGAATVLRYEGAVAAEGRRSMVDGRSEEKTPGSDSSSTFDLRPSTSPSTSLLRRRPKLVIGFAVYLALIVGVAVFLGTRKKTTTVAEVPLLTEDQIHDDLARPVKRDLDRIEGQKCLDGAMALYDKRFVAPHNLYAAIRAFAEAEAYNGSSLSKPEHIQAFQGALKDLAKKVNALYFQAYALQQSSRYNDATAALAGILDYVNDPDSATFQNVTQRINALKPLVEQPRWGGGSPSGMRS